jgi:hypothetical protein
VIVAFPKIASEKMTINSNGSGLPRGEGDGEGGETGTGTGVGVGAVDGTDAVATMVLWAGTGAGEGAGKLYSQSGRDGQVRSADGWFVGCGAGGESTVIDSDDMLLPLTLVAVRFTWYVPGVP